MLVTQFLLLPLLAAQALAEPFEQDAVRSMARSMAKSGTKTTHISTKVTHEPTATAKTSAKPAKPYVKKSVTCTGGTKKRLERAHFAGFTPFTRSFELNARTCYRVACIGKTAQATLCNEAAQALTVKAVDFMKAGHDLFEKCFKKDAKKEGAGIVKATGNWSLTVKKSNRCSQNTKTGQNIVIGPLKGGRKI